MDEKTDTQIDDDILACKADIQRLRNSPAAGDTATDVIEETTPQRKEKPQPQQITGQIQGVSPNQQADSSAATDTEFVKIPSKRVKIPKFEEMVASRKTEELLKFTSDDTAEIDYSQIAPLNQQKPSPTPQPDKTASAPLPDDEQKPLSDDGKNVPRFDLARQILAEQRKVAATRRQKPDKQDDTNTPPATAAGTVGRIISQVKKNMAAGHEKPQTTPKLSHAVSGIIAAPENLTSIQQTIIADIVAQDISQYYS